MKIKPITLCKDKKGQVESIILVVITIVIIGIILFFFNHVNKQMYDHLDEYFEESEEYNASEAHLALEDIQAVEGSRIWDWVFLAAFIGLNIQMIVFSFASRQSLVFFWLFVIIGLVVLILATILSNIWQAIANNPEFAVTLTRFPIANAILGTYYPTIITGVFYLFLIILYGKFPGQQRE